MKIRMRHSTLRSMVRRCLREGVMGHIPASKKGVQLMKQYARMIGGSFVPSFDDTAEGVSWPAVVKDGEKQAFEYGDSFFMRDEEGTLVELPIDTAAEILSRYANDVFNRRVDPETIARQLYADIEMARGKGDIDRERVPWRGF